MDVYRRIDIMHEHVWCRQRNIRRNNIEIRSVYIYIVQYI